MTTTKRFFVELLPDQPWPELRRRVQHAEKLGFDLATTADQFVDWKKPTDPWFDWALVLTAFAEATSRIRLAPCVAQIPMRDPATFARQIITIDNVSGGRIEAGLGLGLTVDPGYAMVGVQNWGNPERADRFAEYLTIVDQLLRSGHCDHAGAHYSVSNAAVHPSVQRPRPPITVAAMGPRMMRYAARFADTWNTMSFEAGVDALMADARQLKTKMAAACESEGRDPATIRHSFLLFDADSRASGGRNFYWESVAAFDDVAGTLFELGYDEVGVYYPVDEQREVCETVATTSMPTFRSS